MGAPDDEFYWDWYKHEENLSTNRGSFFLVGQSMLFAAYATLRAASSPRPTTAISLVSILGIFVVCVWLLVSIFHLLGTRIKLTKVLNDKEKRRAEISKDDASIWRKAAKSYNLMGILLPAGVLVTWILLLSVQGT